MAEGSVAVATPAVTHGGFTLSGDGAAEAVETLKAAEAPAEDEVSKAASELGRRGGKAAAEARAEIKAKPIKDKEPAEKKAEAPAEKPAPKAAAEPEGDEAPADSEEPDSEAARRSRARQRVEEATRKAAEERRERERIARERDELRQRLDRLERERQAPQPAEARRAEPDGPRKPQPQDFEDYEQYLDARDQWNRQEWQRETEERQRAEKRAESITSKVRSFQAKVQEAGGADFLAEISEDVQALRPTIALQPGEPPTGANFLADALLLQSEHAPALMRHLSDHPREFQRIAELGSPYQIAMEVGRLAGILESRGAGATAGASPATGQPASKPASKAPPPVRPVTGAPSAAAGDYYREGEDFDSWNKRQRR